MEVRTFSIPQADRRTATGKTPDRGPCLAKHFQYPSSGSTDCNPGLVARGSGEERDFQYPSSGSTDCNVLERLLTPGGRGAFSIPQADRRTATRQLDALGLRRQHAFQYPSSGSTDCNRALVPSCPLAVSSAFSIPQADRRTATVAGAQGMVRARDAFQYPSSGSTDCNARVDTELWLCSHQDLQYPSSGSTDCNPGARGGTRFPVLCFQYPSSGATDCNHLGARRLRALRRAVFQYPSSGSTDCNPRHRGEQGRHRRPFQYPSSGSTDCNQNRPDICQHQHLRLSVSLKR